MKKYILIILLYFILPAPLWAQVREEILELPILQPSYIVPLKHQKLDSIRHTQPVLYPVRRYLKNRHIENPAVRYSLENLKQEKNSNPEVEQALKTLMEYAENQNIKHMLEQVRSYFETAGEQEAALNTLKKQLVRDSLELLAPESDSTLNNLLVNQDLITLLRYIEQDENHLWLREKSRDSVQLTILNASNKPKKLWLNTGRSVNYRFHAENLMGDTITTWVQVYPRGNVVKFHLTEDVFRSRRLSSRKEIEEPVLLSYPEHYPYQKLIEMDKGSIKRNYWTYYSDITLSFGQGYLSKNWSAGGENSLSLLSDLKYFINYKKNSLSFENSFRYRLGALKSGSEKLSKNEDKLEILSKLSHKAFKHWNYAAQFDMNTILFKSYNYPKREEIVGNLLSPAYFTLSVGFDYKPKSSISLYISPIAGKWTYVRDTVNVNPTRYGVEKGKKLKSAAGAKVDIKTEHRLFDFIKADHRLIVFASYYDEPVNVDWQLDLGFNINYFMKTSIKMNAKYDRNNSKKIQFKETLSLDVFFRF